MILAAEHPVPQIVLASYRCPPVSTIKTEVVVTSKNVRSSKLFSLARRATKNKHLETVEKFKTVFLLQTEGHFALHTNPS